MKPLQRIMVLGGYGRYGRYITSALAEMDGIRVIAAGRRPPARRSANSIVQYQQVDASDLASLRTALADVFLLINATGLFDSDSNYDVARVCAETGTHYIDIADNRDYIKNFISLAGRAESNGSLLVTAAGASPSLSALLADTMRHEFDNITDIRVYRSAGNRNPGGLASLKSLLGQAGKTLKVRQREKWHNIDVWSNSQAVRFPRPVGRRRCFCVDAPELDALVERFNADTVIYRFGFELSLYNLGLKLLTQSKKSRGIRKPGKMAQWLLRLTRIVSRFGHDNDVLGVIMSGSKGGNNSEHAAYLVAREGAGLAIPCSTVLTLARKLLQQGVPGSGVARTQDLISFDDVRSELSRHNVVMVRV